MKPVMSKELLKCLADLEALKRIEGLARGDTRRKEQEICLTFAPFRVGDRVKVTTETRVRIGTVQQVTFVGFESCLGIDGFAYLIRQDPKTRLYGNEIHLTPSSKLEKI